MALSIVSSANAADTATASWTFTSGAELQAGDLRLVFCSAPSAGTFSPPSGWTSLFNTNYTGSAGQTQVYSRVFVAGDGTSSWSYSGTTIFASAVINLRGAVTTPNVGPTGNTGTSGTSVIAPTITPTVDNCELLTWHSMSGENNTGTMSVPTGMTQQELARTTGATNGHIGLLAFQALGAGSASVATGTRTSTASVSQFWRAIAVAIAPSVAAARTDQFMPFFAVA